MSDSRKHIDDIFRDGLKDLEIHDTDAVWQRVESSMHPEKKKRRGIWIWFLAGTISLGTIGAVLLKSSVIETEETISAEHVITDPNKNAAGALSAPHSYQSESESEDVQGKGQVQAQERIAKEIPAKNGDQSLSFAQEGHSGDQHLEDPVMDSEEDYLWPNFKDGRSIEDDNGSSTESDVNNTDLPEPDVNTSSDVPSDTLIPEPEPVSVNDSLELEPEPEPEPELTPPFTLRLGIGAGMNLNNQQALNSDPEFPGYSNLKNNNEKSTYGLSLGTTFDVLYNNGRRDISSFMRTGIQYTDIRFKSSPIGYVIRDSFPFLNPNGDTIAMLPKAPRDTMLVPKQKLRYQTVQIPVSFGIEIPATDKLSFNLRAGGQINILAGTQGQTINGRMELAKATSLDMKRFSFGWNAGCGMNYILGEGFLLGADLNYFRLTSDIYSDKGSGGARLSTYNLKISLRYEFGH